MQGIFASHLNVLHGVMRDMKTVTLGNGDFSGDDLLISKHLGDKIKKITGSDSKKANYSKG